jgi:hypothetical protein
MKEHDSIVGEKLLFVLRRRKLIQRLRAVKANWQKLSTQISAKYKAHANKVINQVQEIIGRILAVTLPQAVEHFPPRQDWEFDGPFIGTEAGSPFCKEPENGVPLDSKDCV